MVGHWTQLSYWVPHCAWRSFPKAPRRPPEVHGRQGHQPQIPRPQRQLSIAFSARWRLFHIVWIVSKNFYCYDRGLRCVPICAAVGGRAPPGDGKKGVLMVTGGELGPEVGGPPGDGKKGVSMLTGNEPGRKAGDPLVT